MQIISDFDLTSHNTFGLISKARYVANVRKVDDLDEVSAFAAAKCLRLRVVGGGSNVLLRERIEGVIAIMATKGRSIIAQEDGRVLVRAMAGEDWQDFVAWTIEQGLGGLENLAGIPGTVGAAPVQNIGAYGLELSDRFVSLTAYDVLYRKLVTFDREECRFSYRQSVFKTTNRYVIVDITLALPRPWRPVLGYKGLESSFADAQAIMAEVINMRRQKLPDLKILGNAGSFFHNPVVSPSVLDQIAKAPRYHQADGTCKLSAAWLIETCGLKGAREGQAGVYDNHALIIVNHGGATFGDVSRIASRVIESVRARFNINLAMEPIIV